MNHSSREPFPTQGTFAWARCKRWAGRGTLVLAGAALSAVLIATAFFKVSFADGLQLTPRFALGSWISQLPDHWHWVAGYAVLTALIIPLRAHQWRFTLGERSPDFSHRYHAVAIGAFFHNVIPGKPGELVRAFLLARKQGIPFFESLGSVLVCKLLELIALVTVVTVALAGPLGNGTTARLGSALLAAALLGGVLVAVALLGARYALPLSQHLERKGRVPRLRVALAHMGTGLQATRSPKKLARALLASFGPVLASALAYGIALQALGVHLGIFAGGVVLGAVSLGQLTPGLPVGLGMYYLMTSWAARALGAEPSQAAAFAALTHVATFTPQILVGFVSLLVHRIRPRELLRARQELSVPVPVVRPVAVPAVAPISDLQL